MIEFKRNKETGVLEAWKDGKKIGEVITMGDEITGRPPDEEKEEKNENRRKR